MIIFLSSSIFDPTSLEQDFVFSYKTFISFNYEFIGAIISSIIRLFSLKTLLRRLALLLGPGAVPLPY